MLFLIVFRPTANLVRGKILDFKTNGYFCRLQKKNTEVSLVN